MTDRISCLALAVAGLCACAGGPRAAAGPAGCKPASSRVARSQALPVLDGGRLRTTLVEIAYGPGGSSPAHSHACPVVVYVVDGAIRTRVRGEPEAIYRAGDTFFEEAHGVHEVSANASQEAPAKFLAFFVCDRDMPPSRPAAAGSRP